MLYLPDVNFLLMNNCLYTFVFFLLLTCGNASWSQQLPLPAQVMEDFPVPSLCRPPLPNEKHEPEKAVSSYDKVIDSTPPSAPVITALHTFSWYSVFFEFAPSFDAETGISSYVYGIGSLPGQANLKWWTALDSRARKIPSSSLWTLGLSEGDQFYITIYANNGNGFSSQQVHTSPLSFVWQDAGDAQNLLSYEFGAYGLTASGDSTATFSSSEISTYTHFLDRMIPIIREVYGPPSHAYTVRLVRDLYYNTSNIFFPGSNEIHIGTGEQLDPLLITHELIHSFRDDVILSADTLWQYDTELSGFEEGFAESMAMVCMNRYVELYPNDPIVHPGGDKVYNPLHESFYDMQNRAHLTTKDFWSDFNGMLLCYERYQMAATALLKMKTENADFARLFNGDYYAALNADHFHTNSRAALINTFTAVVNEVEGKPTPQWIDEQRIFDCRIVEGKKIYLYTQYYPVMYLANIIFQRVYFAETFSNGSEWYANGQYHQLNGAQGVYRLFNYAGQLVEDASFITSPAGQPFSGPGEYNGFASRYIALSTEASAEPWPGGDPEDFIFNTDETGLYTFRVTIEGITENYPRVTGDDLVSSGAGVYGGIEHAKEGRIAFRHQSSPDFDTVPVQNGAFSSINAWSSVFDPEYGRGYTVPGKVEIAYRDSTCELYLDRRNVIYGHDNNGTEVFLFDTEKMEHLPFHPDFAVTPVAGQTFQFHELTSDADYWNWSFGDGTTANGPDPAHTFSANGNFTVCMTAGRNEGCRTSICKPVAVNVAGLEEQLPVVTLSPNPVKGNQTLQLSKSYEKITVAVYTASGRKVKELTVLDAAVLTVDFSDYAAGLYTLVLTTDSFVSVLRTVKE